MEFGAGSYRDLESIEHNKREIDNKVGKILKLIQNNGQVKKRSALIELVEDFHKQYQSLYTQYSQLREEMAKQQAEKEISSPSSPFSDSEYFSPQYSDSKEELETSFRITSSKPSFEEDEALHSKYMEALQEIQMADSTNERNRELSALVKVHELHSSQATEQIKELEGELTRSRTELASLYDLKNVLEAQFENKVAEAKQLREKNTQLHSRILELERMSKEREHEVHKILKQMKDNESSLTSRIEDLTAQANNLQLEVVSLRAQNGKLEASKRKEVSAQVKGFKNRVNVMQKELDLVRSEKSQLEVQLDKKAKDIAASLLQIETLEGELERTKAAIEQEPAKVADDFDLVYWENLELEANSLCNQKNKLEELIRSKNQEIDQLREGGERMHARIFELEAILSGRSGDALSPHRKEHDCQEHEPVSAQIMSLKDHIFNLQTDLDTLLSEKNMLEIQNDRLSRDSMEVQFQMENQIHNLTSKIQEQQKILKEQEDTIRKFTEESSKVVRQHLQDSSNLRPPSDSPKHRSLDSPKHLSLDTPRSVAQYAEKKMEELAENFRMKMESHIRILYQRILVAEQIHAETKDSYKEGKERLDHENIELNRKTNAFEAGLRKIREMFSEPAEENVLSESESTVDKFVDNDENLSDPICRISNELQFAKRWITTTKHEIKKLQHSMHSLRLQLNSNEENELLLREKVWNLEAKLSKEGGDKLNCISQLERKVVYLEQLVKEKDEDLIGIGDEKREAIKQLCILIDYHRDRYDHLRKLAASKKTLSFRRAH